MQMHSQTDVLWSKKFHDLGGVKFSKDGQTVLIAEADTVYLYDAYTGEPTMYEKLAMPPSYRRNIHSIDISNDGNFLGAAIMDTLRIWDYNTGKIYNTFYFPLRGSFEFINDTRYIITQKYFEKVQSWGFIIYNFYDGSEVKSSIYKKMPEATTLSSDGKILAFSTDVSDYSMGIILWDIETMQPITTLGYVNALVNDIAFSPDGKYLGVTDSDGYIKVWDLETKEKIVDMLHTDAPGKNLFAEQLCFTNDSQYLITCGGYFQDKTTKIWKIPEFELINYYKHPIASFYTIDISPNDSLLAMFFQFHVHIIGTDFTPTSIADNSIESEATIIPNPVKDLITIELQNPILNTTIVKIYDSKGVLIEQISNNKLPIGSITLTYNCSHLPVGKYFITIEQDDFFKTYSFVKL
jgi:WD40 repeat protein